MTDQPTPLPDQPPPLHEQVRTLESDLVMCREQLAQETERAESYRLDVAALRDALDAPDDADVNQLIDVVHAITELAEKAEKMATSPFNRVRIDIEDGRFTARDAHDLGCELIAAALLAAADAAERGES